MLTLTTLQSHNLLEYDEVCAGTIYHNHGFDTLIMDAGDYTLIHRETNIFGCDSVFTLYLKVLPIYHQELNVSICYNEQYVFNGETLNESGIYFADLSTINGCDSIIMLNLTVYPDKSDSITDEICLGFDYTLNGFNITNPQDTGYHYLTKKDVNGCDSTTVLLLS